MMKKCIIGRLKSLDLSWAARRDISTEMGYGCDRLSHIFDKFNGNSPPERSSCDVKHSFRVVHSRGVFKATCFHPEQTAHRRRGAVQGFGRPFPRWQSRNIAVTISKGRVWMFVGDRVLAIWISSCSLLCEVVWPVKASGQLWESGEGKIPRHCYPSEDGLLAPSMNIFYREY